MIGTGRGKRKGMGRSKLVVVFFFFFFFGNRDATQLLRGVRVRVVHPQPNSVLAQ